MQIGQGVSLRGLHVEQTMFTWNVSGSVTSADVGKAVTIDATADNTIKLAGDGDIPIGLLASFENRVQEGIKVGTVDHHGGLQVAYTGTAPTRGKPVVGSATPGVVKAAPAGVAPTAGDAVPASILNRTMVTAVDSTAGTCTVLFL